jgi:isopentenyl diphosphate isomerase/L-lactate dehydrogenase-like FMN-dependent dehydrogenase
VTGSPDTWWSLTDAADAARAALDDRRWEHLATGAEEEASLRVARTALDRRAFSPRVLTGIEGPALATSVLGLDGAAPLLVAPVGTHALYHDAGEPATVGGAAAVGVPSVVSVMCSAPFAAIGAAASRSAIEWAIQLYPLRDRGLFRAIADEALAAGARAAVLTVDTPVLGRRVRDLRGGFLSGVDTRPYIQAELSRRGLASFWDAWSGIYRWDDVASLVDELPVPVALKGILDPADAVRAQEAGAAAVWVSAHGGRQLDWARAPLDALEAIAEQVTVPLVLDGEIRSGADVAKALALGATAVAVGRPAIWGLAAAGADGVARVLRLLVDQLANVLALLGVARASELTPGHLVPA